VSVVEVADGGRKIRLCKKGVSARPEKSAAAPVEKPEQESFGTSLADKLRAALGENE